MDGNQGKFQIKTWLDIERCLPKRFHASFRMWRVLQQLNHETKSGKFEVSAVVDQVMSILGVTKENVVWALSVGQGIFWNITLDQSSLYIIGYQKVYAHFGCEPQQSVPPMLVDVSRIGGKIANFRTFIREQSVAQSNRQDERGVENG